MNPAVVKAAQAAMQVDQKYDHAGPVRLIGTVYSKSPPWPSSIGDIDKGIEYLMRAVELAPEYPQNHLRYAEALAAVRRVADARAEYRLVLAAQIPAEWARRAERWKREAEEGLRRLP